MRWTRRFATAALCALTVSSIVQSASAAGSITTEARHCGAIEAYSERFGFCLAVQHKVGTVRFRGALRFWDSPNNCPDPARECDAWRVVIRSVRLYLDTDYDGWESTTPDDLKAGFISTLYRQVPARHSREGLDQGRAATPWAALRTCAVARLGARSGLFWLYAQVRFRVYWDTGVYERVSPAYDPDHPRHYYITRYSKLLGPC
jgi:hypothetical protein